MLAIGPACIIAIMDHIPVTHCLKCNNELLYREYRAKQSHCDKCKKLIEDDQYREKLAKEVARANQRVRL